MIWALALFPALAGLVLWALPAPRAVLGALACAVAAATAALALVAGDMAGTWVWTGPVTLQADLTGPAQVIAVAVPAVALPILLYAATMEPARGLSRLLGLLLVFTGGMELILIAADLVTLLIGWEIVGACSFALIAHDWRRAVPDGAFAFVATRLADLGLFLALVACFAATGETGFGALGTLEGPALTVAGYGIALAAIGKAGLLPFSPWLFRAMAGPVPVSALLHSAAMVAAGVYLLARLWPEIGGAPGLGAALMALGLVTALAGGVEALRRRHSKKVLAASTSAQMGLMIATVGAGFPGVALLHLLVHAAFKAGLFLNAGVRHEASGSYDITRGAGAWVFWLSLPLALALAALPPLGGGWSKEEMLAAVGHAGPAWGVAFAVAGALSAAYAVRFLLAGRDHGDLPLAGGIWATALFSLATLGLSALWLPEVHDAAATVMSAELPQGKPWETLLSLGLLAAGLAFGLWAARHPRPAPERAWFGLSALLDPGLTRRFTGFCAALARADDRVLDAIPSGIAMAARGLSGAAARSDTRWIDGLRSASVGATLWTARTAGAGDRRWIDGTEAGTPPGLVAAVTRGTEATAHLSAGAGERAADRIPDTTARLARALAGPLRRLHTGMAHHAYTFLIAGLAAALLLLLLGD